MATTIGLDDLICEVLKMFFEVMERINFDDREDLVLFSLWR